MDDITISELRDALNKLIEETPDVANDSIYFYNPFDLLPINKVDIHNDLYFDNSKYVVME